MSAAICKCSPVNSSAKDGSDAGRIPPGASKKLCSRRAPLICTKPGPQLSTAKPPEESFKWIFMACAIIRDFARHAAIFANMKNSFKVAVAGAGTVGGAVLRLLHDNAEIIAARCGRRVEVCAVGARDAAKARARYAQYAPQFVKGWRRIAEHPEADAVVE